MKSSILFIASACLAVVSCEKKQSEVSAAPEPAPPAVQVETPAPPAVVVEEQTFEIAEEEPAEVVPSPTPGQRLDHAIERTEHGLGTARDKTEEGLRKAAEKTGNFLQRAGETIERKASE